MKTTVRFLAAMLLAVLLFSACGGASSSSMLTTSPGGTLPDTTGTRLAFIAPVEEQDAPLVQAVWNAIALFAGENGVSHGFYKMPAGEEESTLQLAEKNGAELIVLAGNGMANLLSAAPLRYPNLRFLLVDDTVTQPILLTNSSLLHFLPEQAGWLAGYAAVCETQGGRLAFFEAEDEASRRYALGFCFGAEAAAEALDLAAKSVWVSPVFVPADGNALPAALERIAAGCDLIFTNYAPAQEDVLYEATLRGTSAIAAGYDYVPAQPAALSAAQCSPRGALYALLAAWRDSVFPGGRILAGDISNEGARLLMNAARFSTFTAEQYDAARAYFIDNGVAGRMSAYIQGGHTTSPLELDFPRLTFGTQPQSSVSSPDSRG